MCPTAATVVGCSARIDFLAPIPRSGIIGGVKGGLTVEEPEGPRWDLALDLIENGTEFVILRRGLVVSREASGPVHLAVVIASGNDPIVREGAQATIDASREIVDQVAGKDERFSSMLARFGSLWEVVTDDGSGTIQLATTGDDGNLIWAVS